MQGVYSEVDRTQRRRTVVRLGANARQHFEPIVDSIGFVTSLVGVEDRSVGARCHSMAV